MSEKSGIERYAEGKDVWKCGSLTYNRTQLIFLFFWLLLGGSALYFLGPMTTLFTLSLRHFNTPPDKISIIIGTIPAILNAVICPIVSFKSDRTRSRWGRRIPYILISVPCITISLVVVGMTPYIAAAVSRVTGLSLDTIGWVTCGCFVAIYYFFYNFVASVFYYLYADVVPDRWTGTFNACFHLVGCGTGMIFNLCAMPYVDRYMPLVYGAVAVFVFSFFMAMCVMVREGEYPPPPEPPKGNVLIRAVDGVKVFARECFFSHPFYFWFFLVTALNEVSIICRNMFAILFSTETLHLSVKDVGIIGFWGAVLGLALTLPLGWLVDKFRAIWVYTSGMVLVIVASVSGYFFVNDFKTQFIITMITGVVYAIQNIANLPLFIDMLPKDRYGQFCSAQAVFRSIIMVISTVIAGVYIKHFGYRHMYVWDAVVTSIAFAGMFVVFRWWRKLGGPEHYTAP